VDDWVAEVDKLRADFLRASRERLVELDQDLQLLSRDGADQATARAAHRLFHKLAGSGSTFGYPDVTEVARVAERMLWDRLKAGRHLTLDDVHRLSFATAAIRRTFEGRA
jgi:chemotaxis protein histidine kinase CheA